MLPCSVHFPRAEPASKDGAGDGARLLCIKGAWTPHSPHPLDPRPGARHPCLQSLSINRLSPCMRACWRSVPCMPPVPQDLARLSLSDPEYLAIHAEASAPTPLKLQQACAVVGVLVWPGVRPATPAPLSCSCTLSAPARACTCMQTRAYQLACLCTHTRTHAHTHAHVHS